MENYSTNPKETLKRHSLTIKDRLKILERLELGEQATQLADEFKVSRSTISHIKKKKDVIFKTKTTIEACGGNLGRKRFKGTEESELEKSLFEWYCQRKNDGDSISGPSLCEKALELNKTLGGSDNFKASTGWLSMFKKRHGIKLSYYGEKSPEDIQASEEFQKTIDDLINVSEIDSNYIYNCDVTGLFWKHLPCKNLTRKKQKNTEKKMQTEEKVTVLMCTNASGTHKVPLHVIGSKIIPNYFLKKNRLPVTYKHHNSASLNRELMMEWYKDIFLPEITKRHQYKYNSAIRIILLIDNTADYLFEEEFDEITEFCTIMFFPSNTKSLIQPMDHGIIQQFKRNYKTLFLKRMIAEEISNNTDDIMSLFNILDCCLYSAIAWDGINTNVIKNAWGKLVSSMNGCTAGIESVDTTNVHYLLTRIPRFSSISPIDTCKWLNADINESGWQPHHISEARNILFIDTNNENVDVDEVEIVDEKPKIQQVFTSISLNKAYEGLSMFIDWHRSENPSLNVDLDMLEESRQYIINKLVMQK